MVDDLLKMKVLVIWHNACFSNLLVPVYYRRFFSIIYTCIYSLKKNNTLIKTDIKMFYLV